MSIPKDPAKKMHRALRLTIIGAFGLRESIIWLMDRDHLTFLCQEHLLLGTSCRARLEINARLLDLEISIQKEYGQEESGAKRGYLHLARYNLVERSERDFLLRELSRLND